MNMWWCILDVTIAITGTITICVCTIEYQKTCRCGFENGNVKMDDVIQSWVKK